MAADEDEKDRTEASTPVRSSKRRDTHPLLRTAVLLCREGDQASNRIARLREMAWERELFLLCLAFDDAGGVPAIIQGFPDAVIAVADTNPPSLPALEELRAVRASRGATLVLPSVLDERGVRAAVEAIETAILGQLDASSSSPA